jgi:sec-independent protein translocase protein TatA
MGIPAPTELLLILAIVALIFGGKKIPELMSGVGQGIKIFKKSLEGDDEPARHDQAPPAQPLPPADAKPVQSASHTIEPK